jgi:hypothetical protein
MSDAIKFIDEIKNGKIVRTEYFGPENGESIYERKNEYEGDMLKRIAITGKYDQRYGMIRMFFSAIEGTTDMKYIGIGISEGSDAHLKVFSSEGRVYSSYTFSEGLINKEYQPLEIKSTIVKVLAQKSRFEDIQKEDGNAIGFEHFEYSSMGNFTAYRQSYDKEGSGEQRRIITYTETEKTIHDRLLNEKGIGFEITYIFSNTFHKFYATDNIGQLVNPGFRIYTTKRLKDDLYFGSPIEDVTDFNTYQPVENYILLQGFDESVNFDKNTSTLDFSDGRFSEYSLFMVHFFYGARF